jgi:hypothetical protein
MKSTIFAAENLRPPPHLLRLELQRLPLQGLRLGAELVASVVFHHRKNGGLVFFHGKKHGEIHGKMGKTW